MNVDTMRAIDHYAGVPLTFIATLFIKFLPINKTRRNIPKKVLLVELSEMGSAILVDPAMEKLKKNGAELFFVIFKKNKPSLQLLNTVEDKNIFTIREDSIVNLILDTLKFLKWCRKNQIDTVIDLELFSRFTALLTGLCGAGNRVGYYRFHNEGLYRGEMLTHKVSYNPHIHITKNFIALVNALYSNEREVPYSKSIINNGEMVLKKAEIKESDKKSVINSIKEVYPNYKDEPIVLVNANASDLLPQRRWSQYSYGELIKKILKYKEDVIVLLTGAPSESDGLQLLANSVDNKRCINFSGCIKFLELPALYSISKIMISNDSGPAHFASVTDISTFVLFGPETPELYHALGDSTPIYAGLACSPCVSASNHRKTSCTDNKCLQAITPEMVFDIIKDSLDSF